MRGRCKSLLRTMSRRCRLLLAVQCVGPDELPRADRPHPGRLSRRHRARRRGAHRGRQVRADLGQAGRGREHHRRERQHRGRPRRQVAARRLHAADGRQLVADHERQPERQAAVRSGQGFRADQPDLRRREPAGGASGRAGEEHRRAGRARAGKARRAHLRPYRPRLLAASCRRAVQVHGEGQHPAGRLSRLDRGAARPARRASHHVVQQRGQRRAAGAGGKAARLRGDLAQALGRGARSADHGGVRISGLRGGAVVRPAGADRNAAGDHRQGAPGDREGRLRCRTCASSSGTQAST